MRPPRHAIKILTAVLVLGLLACGWVLFAPTAVGGSTSWVVTDGISMEPRFHSGDLALVRQQSDYRAGQIVAYRNRQLDTIVLHRIVARDGSRYVFKGDNNNFLDFEHPRRSQLLGALWMHVPGAGRDLASIRSPALIGGLFAIATLLLGGAAFTRHRRRRRRERREPETEAPAWRAALPPAPVLLAAGLVAMTPFFVLALLSFTRPATSQKIVSLPYRQHGTISYSATTTPGAAYPDGRVTTGEPLFTHVVHAVQVHFSYGLQSRAARHVRTRAWLTATIASSSGWRTTIPLGAPRTLSRDGGAVSARLDLGSLLALVARVEAMTAVRGAYTLTIAPQARTTGTVGGAPVRASYSPQAKFSLNQLEVRPVTPTGAASEAEPSATMFSRSAAGAVTVRRARASQLSLGIVQLPVAAARVISLVGLALLTMILLAAISLPRARRRDETAAILARYGPLIVPVACVWQQPGVAVIDVADIDALVKIAAHYERSILHEQTDYGDAFWVADESGQFRYAVWTGAEDEATLGAEDEEPYEEILAVDARGPSRADTIEFGAASPYPAIAPQT